MQRFTRIKMLGAVLLGITVLGPPSPTQAAFELRYSTNGGVSYTTVTDNGGGDLDHMLGGIQVKSNGKVKMTDSAVVKSDGPAIDLSNNGHLTITSSRVESKTTAVHATFNLEGTLRAATLVGPRDALDIGNNSHLTVAQSQLQGAKKLGSNSSIDDR